MENGSSPRVRGTQRCIATSAARVCGSSPRVRGTPPDADFACTRMRFIPACAGNSPTPWFPRWRTAVHPRVCGELPCRTSPFTTDTGSSPRVRGTPHRPDPRRRGDRFIPACAGNSVSVSVWLLSRAVHPRVCGELPARLDCEHDRRRFIPACAGNSCESHLPSDGQGGSSPRVRGTRGGNPAANLGRRFIPACAGNSGEIPAGEPRADRFIPACAGNSSRRVGRLSCRPVHPRVCGELTNSSRRCSKKNGSSPRVRGTRVRGSGCRCRRSVHPRVCGELGWHRLLRDRAVGSSPRVRGTPRRRWCPRC